MEMRAEGPFEEMKHDTPKAGEIIEGTSMEAVFENMEDMMSSHISEMQEKGENTFVIEDTKGFLRGTKTIIESLMKGIEIDPSRRPKKPSPKYTASPMSALVQNAYDIATAEFKGKSKSKIQSLEIKRNELMDALVYRMSEEVPETTDEVPEAIPEATPKLENLRNDKDQIGITQIEIQNSTEYKKMWGNHELMRQQIKELFDQFPEILSESEILVMKDTLDEIKISPEGKTHFVYLIEQELRNLAALISILDKKTNLNRRQKLLFYRIRSQYYKSIEIIEKLTTNYSFNLDPSHKITVEAHGLLENGATLDIEITDEDGNKFNLAELGPEGVVHFVCSPLPDWAIEQRGDPKLQFGADIKNKTVFIPFQSETVRKDFPKLLFVILHEIGHLHQEYVPDNIAKVLETDGEPDIEEKTKKRAELERNAWARALNMIRNLRKNKNIDPLAPYKNQKEAFRVMHFALGSYEISALKKLGPEFERMFIKKEIPETPGF